MFYLPFKLRNQTEYSTPKGPNFKRAPLIKFSINETSIQLRVPRHRTHLPTEPRHVRNSYDLEKLNLDYCFMDRPEWTGLSILYRIWGFYGPWFTGSLARVDMSLTIISPDKPRENHSFFHPRAFEGALADYLTYCHGAERKGSQNEQAWLAPVNWNPIARLPCKAASFDVVENSQGRFQRGEMSRYLCFPLTDHHILCVFFFIGRNQFFPDANEPDRAIDDWINIAPMKALTDNVMDSLQIVLSPEAKAQQARALSGMDDTSLVKEFSPLKWL